jgi:uncharacterized integral membrane protein (TIGR00698 family)
LRLFALLPGIGLSGLIALAATLLAQVEADMLGRAWLEPMVLAILLGMALANLWRVPGAFAPGVVFSAKTLLDIAVALLGATLSWAAIAALGGKLFFGIMLLVLVALGLTFVLARALGLSRRLSILIAAGNSICGNSAIAAVAPIVGARPHDVAAAIALTALIGVIAVLALPFAVFAFGMAHGNYALLTGLTVYAVPQVVAAAAPFGSAVIALATLVKLARVVMLGPLTLLLSVLAPRFAEGGEPPASGRPTLYLPWFIIAFALLATLRSMGAIGDETAAMLGSVSKLLATVAMAALGLGVSIATLREVGPRVALASAGAAILLLLLALAVVQLLGPLPLVG